MTRYWTESHPEPFRRGFSEFTRFYVMLIEGLQYAYWDFRPLVQGNAALGWKLLQSLAKKLRSAEQSGDT